MKIPKNPNASSEVISSRPEAFETKQSSTSGELIIIPDKLKLRRSDCDYCDLRLDSDLAVHAGFDVVTASFLTRYRFDLFPYLEELGFDCLTDSRLESGIYGRHRFYRRASEQIEILYGADLANDQIKLHSPTPPLFGLVDGFFRDKVRLPKLSQVEIAFDFYCDQGMIPHFHDYLKTIAFLKHRRKPSFCYRNHDDESETYYATDRKKGPSSKSWKIYEKQSEGEPCGRSFIRLEITLDRPFLTANGFDALSDLPGVWDLDLSKLLEFHRLNYDKLIPYMKKFAFKAMIRERREMKRPVSPNRFHAFELAARNWVGVVLRGDWRNSGLSMRPQDVPLLEQIDRLKAHEIDYGRFLDPVEDGLFSHLSELFKANRRLWRGAV